MEFKDFLEKCDFVGAITILEFQKKSRGDVEFQKSENPDVRIPGLPNLRKSGFSEIRKSRLSDFRGIGCRIF